VQTMAGYWNNPPQSKRFAALAAYRDMGYVDEDGSSTWPIEKGHDHFGGGKCYASIEEALMSHPSIAEAAVIGIPDTRGEGRRDRGAEARPPLRGDTHRACAH